MADVDADFARDYGEWDQTLPTWRQRMLDDYAGSSTGSGSFAGLDTILMCGRFKVVWPGGAKGVV